MPPSTSSPTLFITSTSQQQATMRQGFIDRMVYKLVFKPIQLNSFHKTTQYVIKKILCQPYIFLDNNNFIYLNSMIANQSVGQILKKMALNVAIKGQQNYIENNKLMKTLRIAIRDSKNLNKLSKYQQPNKDKENQKVNLWYFK